jgi:ribosomal protein S18 acetylase RimI-like enzyme
LFGLAEDNDSPIARLERAVHRYGVGGLPKRAWERIRRRLVGDDSLVYRRDSSIQVDPVAGLRVDRYDDWEQIDPATVESITSAAGISATKRLETHSDDGNLLWVACLDERVAGYLLTVRGSQLDRWHVRIADDDLVVYSVVVFPEFRGRGIAPALVERVIAAEVIAGQHAFIDTKAWNTPAIRFIVKAGFQRVSSSSPLQSI